MNMNIKTKKKKKTLLLALDIGNFTVTLDIKEYHLAN